MSYLSFKELKKIKIKKLGKNVNLEKFAVVGANSIIFLGCRLGEET
jgi:hypothetical protein